ncbi:SDR family NAD(P)-dependent oxidoreductase [Streptomyces justiciae]|uniref:SDR family NAD(P)-dependent oxidoreductase n=1 Tax=Streptomyces justiciae TaxID=2780140 RepID=UPI00211876F7|nr:SDR family NAD(P)-dependent oxidoreductase [Streptomyces justiciae]MCW8382575.1 SDR family NAD(P)-dependent oxidoreductase [Streptomyces justiciae]
MTLIHTPFGLRSTAAEVVAGVDLTGRRAVITGGSSGLGFETARALATAGAEVTLAVRDTAAGERAAADITADTGNKDIHIAQLELADRASVAAFTAAWDGPLHILVNNAGVMALPERELTPEGWEKQFAVNHLGHFALAVGLHGALTAAGDARVVSVSSSMHLSSPVVLDDLHFVFRPYDPMLAYGQSKTANILFAVGAAARWADDGISVNAASPGTAMTNLFRNVPRSQGMGEMLKGVKDLIKTAAQGAATPVLAAASPLLEGVSGRYFADCAEAVPVTSPPSMTTQAAEHMNAVAPYALDPAGADRLWEESLRLTGVR